jgi:membrane protease subunit (stomatin/prohibitin family)
MMKVIGHRRNELCPRCARQEFCDDCGVCAACSFAAPAHVADHPPPPAPAIRCSECQGGMSHTRECSHTLRAAAS